MSVWICQCLCPARHCILAVTGEFDTERAAVALRVELRRAVVGLLASGAMNPWCGLCDAKRATWRYEVRRTIFATMAAAEPGLREIEAAQARTRRAWGDLHKTSRPN